MAVNIKLLRTVRKLIVEENRRLNMRVWGQKADAHKKDAPACGYTACLAGWIVLAATPYVEWDDALGDSEAVLAHFVSEKNPGHYGGVAEYAAQLVGIPQRDMPFMEMDWDADRVIKWIDSKIAEVEAQQQQSI